MVGVGKKLESDFQTIDFFVRFFAAKDVPILHFDLSIDSLCLDAILSLRSGLLREGAPPPFVACHLRGHQKPWNITVSAEIH